MKKSFIFGALAFIFSTIIYFSYGNQLLANSYNGKGTIDNNVSGLYVPNNLFVPFAYSLLDDYDDILSIHVVGNGYEHDSYIIYRPDASDDYDFQYDAVWMPGLPAAPQIYTKKIYQGTEMNLVVHSLNNINNLHGKIVYLTVGAQTQYTISFSHSIVQAFTPVMRDRQLDVIIYPDQNYVFTASPSDALDRFEILNADLSEDCDATITTSLLTYCSNSSAIQFTAQDAGGVWTGNGITADGIFTPATAGAGTHTITYTISGSCNDQDQVQVTVYQTPLVNLGGDQTLCQGVTHILDAGSGFSSYAWSPSGNSQTINVTQSGAYSVTVTDGNNCQGTASVNITFIPSADATITTSTLTFCQNDSPILFTSLQQGGVWSGNGITSIGLFTPENAGAGTHTITYTIAGTCGDEKSVEVTVYANPIVNLGEDQTICQGEELILDAGAGFSNYTWAPSGNTQTYTVSQTGIYAVTVTGANNCKGFDNIFINVVESADATITTLNLTYCSNDNPILFTSLQAGGLWSGNGISGIGLFDPTAAGTGTHTITYTISGNCGDEQSVEVTVYETPVVDLGSDQTICQGESIILDAGAGYDSYTWSPNGNEQTFTVTESGIYSVTVSLNNCHANDNVIINVTAAADATITTSQLTFCTNDNAVQFTALQVGGVWSGTGINANGIFNPTTAGAGKFTITYTISGNCGDEQSVEVTVTQAPVVNLGSDQTICQGESVILDAGAGYDSYIWTPNGNEQTFTVTETGTYSVTVSLNSCFATDNVFINVLESADASITTTQLTFCTNDNAVQFTALQAGGVWSGTGINANGIFNPATAGAGTYTITYTISGNCGDEQSVEVTVTQAPVVNLGSDQTVCFGEVVLLDAGEGFDNYSWSPEGNTQTFTVTETGTYSVTVSLNNCFASDNIFVNVTEGADATITTTQLSYCTGNQAVQFTAQDAGGVWTGNGITSTGMFNPTEAGIGTHEITYTISGTCGDSDMIEITVNESYIDEISVNICKGETYLFGEIELFETGTYTEEYISVWGCDSIIILQLTVDSIDVSVTQESNILTANNMNAISYQWINCDTQIEIEGATDMVFEAEENGNYAVIITEFNCTDTSECYTVLTVSASDIFEAIQFQVYPNPTSGELYIRTNNAMSVTIKNVIGSIMYISSFDAGTHQIDVSFLPDGIYFIENIDSTMRTVHRFVKSGK